MAAHGLLGLSRLSKRKGIKAVLPFEMDTISLKESPAFLSTTEHRSPQERPSAHSQRSEFFVMYCITFTFLLLCLVPFWVHLVTGCDNLRRLHCFNIFTGIFMKIFGTL